MNYSTIGMLAIFVHLIINYDYMKQHAKGTLTQAEDRYRQFLFAVMFYYFSDIFWGVLYEAGLTTLAFIDTTLYFLSMAFSVFYWTHFVVTYLNQKNLFNRLLTYSGWAILLTQILMLIINMFNPVSFYFDENHLYHPLPVRYLTLVAQIIIFALTSVYTLSVTMHLTGPERDRHRTVAFSGLIMTVFVLFQNFYPFVPFYAMGCLLATCIIHTFIYRDKIEERAKEIGTMRRIAYIDALTGVKNKMAYTEAVTDLERRVHEGKLNEYGVAVFDLNYLKYVNDNMGHEIGDKYIKEACAQICRWFQHSPVYRIGGDEFVVLLKGADYDNREMILKDFNDEVYRNKIEGKAVVSVGCASYQARVDRAYDDVFRRADKLMYQRKQELKWN